MGVRRGDSTLARKLNEIIARRHGDIERILLSYGTPLVGDSGTPLSVPIAANAGR
jgi:hypothetical protein